MGLNKQQFDEKLMSVRSRGKRVTEEFVELVPNAVELYWGETNHNIQVINDVIDCARDLKGIRVLSLVEYLSQCVPHKNNGKRGMHLFGRMDKDLKTKYQDTWADFLRHNPDWTTFTDEKPPAPFDISNYLRTVTAKLQKAHNEGSLEQKELDEFKAALQKWKFKDEAAA